MDLFGHSINRIKDVIVSESYSDEITKQTILDVFARSRYILDPHSAIGYLGLKKYAENAKDEFCGMVLATAHPAKFNEVVEQVIDKKIELPEQLFACLNKEKKSKRLINDFFVFKDFLMA